MGTDINHPVLKPSFIVLQCAMFDVNKEFHVLQV